MSLAAILKFAGLLISAISGIIALLGDPRVDGKLTRTGKALFGFIVAGVIIAILGDQLADREGKRIARMEREWENILEEPLRGVNIGYYLIGEVKLSDIRRLAESTEITFTHANSTPNKRRHVGFKFDFPVVGQSDDLQQHVRIVVHHGNSESLESESSAKFYKPEEHRGYVCAVWSSEAKWKSDSNLTNGISGDVSWQRLRLPEIQKVKDLRHLAFRFERPDDLSMTFKVFNGHDVAVLSQIEIRSQHFIFRLDPAALGFTSHTDETSKPKKQSHEASIEGPKLLAFFRKQFFDSGGIKSDERISGDKLKSVTATIMSITKIVQLQPS